MPKSPAMNELLENLVVLPAYLEGIDYSVEKYENCVNRARCESGSNHNPWHQLYELTYKDFLSIQYEHAPTDNEDAKDDLGYKDHQLAIVAHANISSLATTSLTVHDLIRQVTLGSERAVFYALRSDPASIYCSPIQKRYLSAVYSSDKVFLKKVGNAIRSKPISAEQRDLGTLRLALEFLFTAGVLAELTPALASSIFIDQLKLYRSTGSDPEGSLWREIKRMKKKQDNKSQMIVLG